MEPAKLDPEPTNPSPLPIKKTFGEDGTQVEFNSEAAADHLDVVFCIDVTGSMASYIARSKKVIANMINYFSQSEDKPFFGVVAYRDHPPQDNTFVTIVHQLSNAEKALEFVDALRASGGGDTPEAVLQGLLDSVQKIQWRNIDDPKKTYKKLIVHVGDAPPHGKEFHEVSLDDTWPNGCPSGITMPQLASNINESNILYHFCRLNTSTDIMQEKFMKEFKFCEIIDMVITKGNTSDKKTEFDEYKKEHGKMAEFKKEWNDMGYKEQQECYYESACTMKMAKHKKK